MLGKWAEKQRKSNLSAASHSHRAESTFTASLPYASPGWMNSPDFKTIQGNVTTLVPFNNWNISFLRFFFCILLDRSTYKMLEISNLKKKDLKGQFAVLLDILKGTIATKGFMLKTNMLQRNRVPVKCQLFLPHRCLDFWRRWPQRCQP